MRRRMTMNSLSEEEDLLYRKPIIESGYDSGDEILSQRLSRPRRSKSHCEKVKYKRGRRLLIRIFGTH